MSKDVILILKRDLVREHVSKREREFDIKKNLVKLYDDLLLHLWE
ncbi:MAG: hypothetical protein WKF36_05855 [Candidatus Nitrosocosmicus sp.]